MPTSHKSSTHDACNINHHFPGRVHFRDYVKDTYKKEGWVVFYNCDGSTPDLQALQHIPITDLFENEENSIYLVLMNGESIELPIKYTTTLIAPEGLTGTIKMPKIELGVEIWSAEYKKIFDFMEKHYKPSFPTEDEPFGVERYEAQACNYENTLRGFKWQNNLDFFLKLTPFTSPLRYVVIAKKRRDFPGELG